MSQHLECKQCGHKTTGNYADKCFKCGVVDWKRDDPPKFASFPGCGIGGVVVVGIVVVLILVSTLWPKLLEDVGIVVVLVLIVGVIGLAVWHGFNPKNPVSRGIEGFWNAPAIERFRLFIWKVFWFCFLGILAIAIVSWYFNESGWYPRTREVRMYFNARGLIDGEIQTCYSGISVTEKDPDAELQELVCTFEKNEFHVLRVTFWGPIKADKNKIWKCERSSTTMVCKLQ